MHVRPIEHGSAEYDAYCDLRRRFLREPLGLELTEGDVEGEDAQHLFGLFDDTGRLLGGLIGKPENEPATVRLRQVVVHADRRGAGLGRRLMDACERRLVELGYARCVLYARGEAAAFYERCGYTATGVTRELIGLDHQEMVKPIGPS